MFRNFMYKMSRFMQGRYGMDMLNRILIGVALFFMILSWFRYLRFMYFVAFAVLIYVYFRMFSRNIEKRYKENQVVVQTVSLFKAKFANRKTHKVFRCPNCSQQIRVPKNKGRISIKCPKCRIEFIKKT